jgi:hypothetical protein
MAKTTDAMAAALSDYITTIVRSTKIPEGAARAIIEIQNKAFAFHIAATDANRSAIQTVAATQREELVGAMEERFRRLAEQRSAEGNRKSLRERFQEAGRTSVEENLAMFRAMSELNEKALAQFRKIAESATHAQPVRTTAVEDAKSSGKETEK